MQLWVINFILILVIKKGIIKRLKNVSGKQLPDGLKIVAEDHFSNICLT